MYSRAGQTDHYSSHSCIYTAMSYCTPFYSLVFSIISSLEIETYNRMENMFPSIISKNLQFSILQFLSVITRAVVSKTLSLFQSHYTFVFVQVQHLQPRAMLASMPAQKSKQSLSLTVCRRHFSVFTVHILSWPSFYALIDQPLLNLLYPRIANTLSLTWPLDFLTSESICFTGPCRALSWHRDLTVLFFTPVEWNTLDYSGCPFSHSKEPWIAALPERSKRT